MRQDTRKNLLEIAADIGATLTLPSGSCHDFSQGDADRAAIMATLTEAEQSLLRQPVTGLATLEAATANQLSFLANSQYRPQLATTAAMAVIVKPEDRDACPVMALVVTDPYAAFARLSQSFEYAPVHDTKTSDSTQTAQVHETASISEGVVLGHHVVIGAHVSIGRGTRIGANTVIGDAVVIGIDCDISANVTIHHHCELGSHVRVHAGACIGADGFGFAPVMPTAKHERFRWERIAQLGRVVIGHHVRIGANTCIDRGALSDTVIADGVIIDNLVQIAHNVEVGEHTAMAACVGIAGSTKIGKGCILAGNVGVAGHLTIADGVTLTAATKVTRSLPESGSYSSGVLQMPTNQWRRAAINQKQLADYAPKKLASQISDLKTELNRLKSLLDALSVAASEDESPASAL